MPDLVITPNRSSSTSNPVLTFVGLSAGNNLTPPASSIYLTVLPEGQVAFMGSAGSLFSITDSLTGSLMSVGDITGLPILEVFSDDRVVMGGYNNNTLIVSGAYVGIGRQPSTYALNVSGDVNVSGAFRINGTAQVGAQGNQGNQGNQGAAGAQGNQGNQGAAGAQGAQGAQGVQGASVTGAQGAQGYQGVQGVSGYQGFQGVSGYQGFSGASGYQGFQGRQGSTGTGAQGAQGAGGAGGSAATPSAAGTLFGCSQSSSYFLTSLGYFAGQNNSACGNVAIGAFALCLPSGVADTVAIGMYALGESTGGGSNVAIGRDVLRYGSYTSCNVGIGSYALALASSAQQNTAIGANALYNLQSGTCNVAVGFEASNGQYGGGGGSFNTTLGACASRNITNNCYNTLIGFKAGECGKLDANGYNTNCGCNTALGAFALNTVSLSGNTGIGYKASFCSQGAENSIAIGTCALYYNGCGVTSGNTPQNIAIGTCAMFCDTTGANNIAIGTSALKNVQTGNKHIAIGCNAMCSHCVDYPYGSDVQNIAIGTGALCSAGTASNCAAATVAIGTRTLECISGGIFNTVAIGANALMSASTGGGYSAAVGSGAGCATTTGACNVYVGYNSGASNSTGSGQTIVGHNTSGSSANNIIVVGCGANTSATAGHTVWGTSNNNVCNCVYAAWSNVSDCRDKTCIAPLPDKLGLQFIKELNPVTYHWDNRDTYVREYGCAYGEKDGSLVGIREHYGVIAQDVKTALDKLNIRYDALGHDSEKDAYRITYEELIAPIIKAIKELDTRLTYLENK